MMTLPVATIVVLADTTIKLDKLSAKIVALANTTIKLDNLPNPMLVKIAAPASTTINLARAAQTIVLFARAANTPRNLPPRPSLNATHVNRDVL